jgi:hypothetical protein
MPVLHAFVNRRTSFLFSGEIVAARYMDKQPPQPPPPKRPQPQQTQPPPQPQPQQPPQQPRQKAKNEIHVEKKTGGLIFKKARPAN